MKEIKSFRQAEDIVRQVLVCIAGNLRLEISYRQQLMSQAYLVFNVAYLFLSYFVELINDASDLRIFVSPEDYLEYLGILRFCQIYEFGDVAC